MLITFEGIEGSGKSTQIRHVARYLHACGRPFVITKEPGGTGIGAQIRTILLDPANTGLDPVAELLLYAADRRQHIHELIRPALQEGKIVVCDRFHDSTIAYQGFSRALDMELIQNLNRWVLGDIKPDVTFLLDLDPAIGLARAWREVSRGGRTQEETRFENEALFFHQKVRQGYLELARQEPGRFVVVDAAADEHAVGAAILGALAEKADLAV